MNDANHDRAATSGGVPPAAGGPYRVAAQRFADALVEHGRDHYGPLHTPLFVHTLDLRTLEIPRQRTPAEWRAEMATWNEDRNYLMWGKDRSSVAWAQDSNLLWDTEAVRLLYALSAESGEGRFAAAADGYLSYFLDHCVSRTTGLFAWGEHVAYNVLDDRIYGERHELQHADPLWEELWRLDSDAVVGEIEGVYRYHITDKLTMAYDRHAGYWTGLPERDQATILGYNGIYADAFAFLFRKTGEPKYQEWARKLMLSFQAKSEATGLYPENWTEMQARELEPQYPARPSLASAMYVAYELTGDYRWLDDANRYLRACVLKLCAERAAKTDQVFDRTGLVEAGVRAYRITNDRGLLDIALDEGEALLAREQPHAQMAASLAASISGFADLYEASREKRWLDAARALGDHALRVFVHPSGLIRGTAVVDRPDYYDAIQGPGALALALYRLGGLSEARCGEADDVANRRAASIEANTDDDRLRDGSPTARGGASQPDELIPPGNAAPPEISDWRYPEEARSTEWVLVSVRITSPAGVTRAVLHYARGNEIGFTAESPDIDDDHFAFRIAPLGLVGARDVSFAVEAVGAEGGRVVSEWHKLRLFSEEVGRFANGALRFETLGVTIACAQPSSCVSAAVVSWLPDGVKGPEPPLRSVGRYVELRGALPETGRLTVVYAPEETHRLIESTLALAYWSGGSWTRVPSDRDPRSRTVSTDLIAATCWTLLGEDRVLWRAPGRETGVALADIDGDGRLEVVTTFWQPGELLSSEGQSLCRFPIDPPYHPINNRTAPAAARLSPNGPLLLFFGAPSGYLYAYQSDGTLRWRTEVGGEILGAAAFGRLGPGPASAAVVSWNGGVAAIDSEGRPIWTRRLPEPSGATPVLVALQSEERLDVIINAASGLIALRGETGEPLWEFTAPSGCLTTPSAGAFVRDGEVRIVCGDDTGAVYALTETGSLLWKQDRLFGPREVPEPVAQYAGVAEVGLADLKRACERQVIVTTRSGETAALSARGERLWRFVSYERKVGMSLALGAHLAFGDLDDDGELEIVVSQQDSYLYVLSADGRERWCYRGYFWYHTQPSIADLRNTGELNIVFTAPEDNGTYALRSGHKGQPGRAPWPMARGNSARTNCAPW